MIRQAIAGRFAGKVAVVTGGANGIGQATANEFCREAGTAVIIDRDRGQGLECVAGLRSADGEAVFIEGDIRDEGFLKEIGPNVLSRCGRVDYLVNNAFSFLAKGIDATRDDWDLTFRVGPIAYALLGAALAPLMKRNGGGAIVNLSSISAFIAQPGRWTYNTAKGAVDTLTKCMALDLHQFGVRVNSVSPGWIWTREVLRAAGENRSAWDPVWGNFHILKRCGDPTEVAAAILFLLSEDASFITGADLPVDGGYQALGSEGNGSASQFAGSE
jgi:NAD(P)-dependent dehydrogenase (short-subunit alcohol dehydrogenase family)